MVSAGNYVLSSRCIVTPHACSYMVNIRERSLRRQRGSLPQHCADFHSKQLTPMCLLRHACVKRTPEACCAAHLTSSMNIWLYRWSCSSSCCDGSASSCRGLISMAARAPSRSPEQMRLRTSWRSTSSVSSSSLDCLLQVGHGTECSTLSKLRV